MATLSSAAVTSPNAGISQRELSAPRAHSHGPSSRKPFSPHASALIQHPTGISFSRGGAVGLALPSSRGSASKRPSLRVCATSSSSSSPSPSSDRRGQSRWDPLLANSDVGCPVPPEQQPVNEYSDLAEALFFSWATQGPVNLSLRLGAIGLFFTLAVGWPVACASFDPQKQALQCVLSALGGGLFPVTLATSRLYLGWQYVGARLSSATVEYEETGWYDGQVWVKTPELLARDRLLASYRIKPVLRRLQGVLAGLGVSLVLIVALVAFLPPYAPRAEPSPYPVDASELEDGLITIVRAAEKGTPSPREGRYSQSAAEEFEGPLDRPTGQEYDDEEDFEDGAVVDSGATPSVDEFYRRLHSPFTAGGGFQPITYTAPGFGFEYLVQASEEDEDRLFTKEEAKELARSLRGMQDVLIVGLTERITDWSEGGFTEVQGSEDLSVLGAGVRSAARKASRISDHLSIGPDGELGVVRSLKPDADE